MGEPSLGQAIGLNYSMPSSAGIINQLQQARKQESAMLAAMKKTRDKDLADLEKYQDDMSKWVVGQQSGLLPIDQEIAKAKAQKVLDAAKSGKRGDVYEAQLDLSRFAQSAKMSAENLMKQGQIGIEHHDKFKLKQEIVDLANSEGNPDNYAKWQKLTMGTGHYMSGVLEPIDNTDWVEGMQKNMVGSGLKYKSIIDPATKKSMGLQAPTQKEIEIAWGTAKSQPWFTKAIAQKVAIGIDPADAEADIKKAYIVSIPKDVSAHSMEPKKGGGALSFGGNTAENDDVRVIVSDTDDRRTYSIAQIKTTENSILDFSLPKDADGNTPVVKGTPLRVEKLKNGQANIVVSVAEVIDDEKTGKFTEEIVPYELNKDRVLAGKLNFTIEGIDKGITEKGVQKKEGGKYIEDRKINGKTMKVYQRPDGSKYAK